MVDCQCHQDGKCLHGKAKRKLFGFPKCVIPDEGCSLQYPFKNAEGKPLPPPGRLIALSGKTWRLP